uniref:Secreted protein n=1 Tax=Oryza rufipogon TaxID=4529 RepID=A0A0E0NFG0_ORYRU
MAASWCLCLITMVTVSYWNNSVTTNSAIAARYSSNVPTSKSASAHAALLTLSHLNPSANPPSHAAGPPAAGARVHVSFA